MDEILTMLSSHSLSFLLTRATKPLHLNTHHGSLSLGFKDNDKETPRRNSSFSQQQYSACRSLDTLSASRTYGAPHVKVDFCVIVADCGGCNCSAFILKLLGSAGASIETDRQANIISFRMNNVAKYITLIEVNFEKDHVQICLTGLATDTLLNALPVAHDLWTTLSFEGCILLYSPSNPCSYRYAMQKLTQLRNLRDKCVLWLIGIVSDPASPSAPPRMIPFEQAQAETLKRKGHYWEVIPDGKTARSPLTYNQIAMELVSLIGDLQVDVPAPDKITFEFGSDLKVARKISRSCEHISFS